MFPFLDKRETGSFPAVEKDRQKRRCFLQFCPAGVADLVCVEAYGAEGPGRGLQVAVQVLEQL